MSFVWEMCNDQTGFMFCDYGDGLVGVVRPVDGYPGLAWGYLTIDAAPICEGVYGPPKFTQKWLNNIVLVLREWSERRAERRYASASGT